LVSFGANGALHKWVDADGKTHYSDAPPPSGIKAKNTAVSGGSVSVISAPTTFVERGAKATHKSNAEVARQLFSDPAEDIKRRNICADAKDQLRSLASNPQFSSYAGQDESDHMDDWARQQNMREARKQIGLNCKAE
jgi:hypothetical protein